MSYSQTHPTDSETPLPFVFNAIKGHHASALCVKAANEFLAVRCLNAGSALGFTINSLSFMLKKSFQHFLNSQILAKFRAIL